MDITTLGAAVAMAKKVMPQVTSADAGKLATVDSNGKWAAAELEVGQGEVAVDSTLLVTGAAADAKVTGDKVAELKSAITSIAGATRNLFDASIVAIGTNDSGGSNYRRAISAAMYVGASGGTVTCKTLPANLKYEVHGYSDANYSGNTAYGSWITNTTTTKKTAKAYVRILFGTVNDAAITAADFEGIELQVEAGQIATEYIQHETAVDTVARDAIADVKDQISLLYDNSLSWNNGYITNNGAVAIDQDRRYSDLAVCIVGATVKYVSESGHSGVNGISFYDADENYISGVSNNGTTGNEVSVTVPANASYLRLSATKTLAESGQSYYKLSGKDFINDIYGKFSGIAETMQKVLYIAPNGDDTNDGLSAEYPLATLGKAIQLGGTDIRMKRGRYTNAGTVSISGKDSFRITPSDNNETYANAHPNRQKIEIICGVVVSTSDMSDDDGLKKFAFAGNTKYNAVFVSKTTDPVSSAQFKIYNANLVLKYADPSIPGKLLPVLSVSDCKTTPNSFTFDGTYVYFNAETSGYTEAYIQNDSSNGISISSCKSVYLEDVSVANAKENCIKIANSNDIVLMGCETHYALQYMGFSIDNCNARLIDCLAVRAAYDGFNFHSYGDSVMTDCVALYCYDDGCSHHDGCVGNIDGGRFVGCGKGGLSPAYGAQINIRGVLCKDNVTYGIGYLSTDNGHQSMKGFVSDCALVDNPIGLKVDALCTVDAWNIKYNGNTSDKSVAGTLNEY